MPLPYYLSISLSSYSSTAAPSPLSLVWGHHCLPARAQVPRTRRPTLPCARSWPQPRASKLRPAPSTSPPIRLRGMFPRPAAMSPSRSLASLHACLPPVGEQPPRLLRPAVSSSLCTHPYLHNWQTPSPVTTWSTTTKDSRTLITRSWISSSTKVRLLLSTSTGLLLQLSKTENFI